MDSSEMTKSEDSFCKIEAVNSSSVLTKPSRGSKRGRGRPKRIRASDCDETSVNGNLQVASLKHVGKFRYLSNLTQPESETKSVSGRGTGKGRGRDSSNQKTTSSNRSSGSLSKISSRGRRIKPNNRWAPDTDFDPGPAKTAALRTNRKVIGKKNKAGGIKANLEEDSVNDVAEQSSGTDSEGASNETGIQLVSEEDDVKTNGTATQEEVVSSQVVFDGAFSSDDQQQLKLDEPVVEQHLEVSTSLEDVVEDSELADDVVEEVIDTAHVVDTVTEDALVEDAVEDAQVEDAIEDAQVEDAIEEAKIVDTIDDAQVVAAVDDVQVFDTVAEVIDAVTENAEADGPCSSVVTEEAASVSVQDWNTTTTDCAALAKGGEEEEEENTPTGGREGDASPSQTAHVIIDAAEIPSVQVGSQQPEFVETGEDTSVSSRNNDVKRPTDLEPFVVSACDNNEPVGTPCSEREDSETSEMNAKESTSELVSSNSSCGNTPIDDETFDASSALISPKPVKVKSRWRRTSELEQVNRNGGSDQSSCNSPLTMSPRAGTGISSSARTEVKSESVAKDKAKSDQDDAVILESRLKSFEIMEENLYLTDKKTSKEVKRMLCDCTLTKEEISRGELGCGEDCINRLLMIECGPRCQLSDRCTNKRFQKRDYAKVEVFNTEKKGVGLRTLEDLEA